MAMNLLDALKKIITALNEDRIEYALCGGLAMAVYALPRATLDIDIMIEADSLELAKQSVSDLGFTLDAIPMEFQGGKVLIQRISRIDSDSGDVFSLDLLIVTPETRPAWESRFSVEWEGGALSVVSPEGLILLKSLRGSGQDQDDIQYLRSITDED
jgi:hypothetical protein